MKKLISFSLLALMLSACSQPHHHKDGNHYGMKAHHQNPELIQAMKACHTQDNMKNMQAFEACLKAKGFERPANHPTKMMHHHNNPALAKAIKECHDVVKSKQDMAKFDACLKTKGFEKPANHPKVKGHY